MICNRGWLVYSANIHCASFIVKLMLKLFWGNSNSSIRLSFIIHPIDRSSNRSLGPEAITYLARGPVLIVAYLHSLLTYFWVLQALRIVILSSSHVWCPSHFTESTCRPLVFEVESEFIQLNIMRQAISGILQGIILRNRLELPVLCRMGPCGLSLSLDWSMSSFTDRH